MLFILLFLLLFTSQLPFIFAGLAYSRKRLSFPVFFFFLPLLLLLLLFLLLSLASFSQSLHLSKIFSLPVYPTSYLFLVGFLCRISFSWRLSSLAPVSDKSRMHVFCNTKNTSWHNRCPYTSATSSYLLSPLYKPTLTYPVIPINPDRQQSHPYPCQTT